MTRSRWILVGCAVILGLVAADPARSQAEELDEDRFRELHAQLQTDGKAPWRTIPWKIGLLDAQQTAAREGKPIFIWAMDGHPLGCT